MLSRRPICGLKNNTTQISALLLIRPSIGLLLLRYIGYRNNIEYMLKRSVVS